MMARVNLSMSMLFRLHHKELKSIQTRLPSLLVTGIPLLLSLTVPLDLLPSGLCLFKGVTGVPCPFCGLTRSFWAVSGGDWAFAARNYPLVFLVYGTTTAVFAWHLLCVLKGSRINPARTGQPKTGSGNRRIMGLLFVLILMNWGYRLGMGLH